MIRSVKTPTMTVRSLAVYCSAARAQAPSWASEHNRQRHARGWVAPQSLSVRHPFLRIGRASFG
jgi:hypothetical protein